MEKSNCLSSLSWDWITLNARFLSTAHPQEGFSLEHRSSRQVIQSQGTELHNPYSCTRVITPTLSSKVGLFKLSCTAHYLTASRTSHIKFFPSTNLYAHFKSGINKWNQNESFYTCLRWKRWHNNETTTFARVSGRDFSQKKAHFSSSCSCCDMIKGDGSGSKYKQVLTYSCFFLLSFADIFLFHLFWLFCLWAAYGITASSISGLRQGSVVHSLTWNCQLLSFCQLRT